LPATPAPDSPRGFGNALHHLTPKRRGGKGEVPVLIYHIRRRIDVVTPG